MDGNKFGWFPEIGETYECVPRWYVKDTPDRVRVESINHKRETVTVCQVNRVIGSGAVVVLTFAECRDLVWRLVTRPAF
jgi:hypothetical protein